MVVNAKGIIGDSKLGKVKQEICYHAKYNIVNIKREHVGTENMHGLFVMKFATIVQV